MFRVTPARRPAILAALLSLLIYAVTLGGTYVYDDLYIVREDPRVLGSQSWRDFWTRDYNNGGVDNLYRPIVSMSYWLQWRVHGDRPWAFHLVNILLHAATAAAVAEFARRLIGMRGAYVAGILFAVHPIHVEAVAGIVGRAELMCALAMLGAMILFMHRPMTIRRSLAICACLILAVLSKEQGMILPFILLFLDRLRDWGKGGQDPLWGKGGQVHLPEGDSVSEISAPATAPSLEYAARDVHDPIRAEKFARQILTLLLCFTLAGYIFLREDVLKLKFYWDRSFLDWTIQPMIRSTGADRWLMPLVLLGHYTALLIAPIRLSIDYGGSVIGWTVDRSDPYLYLGIGAIVAWLAIMIRAVRHKDGPLLFSLLALAMTYGVVGNIVSIIGTNFGERLMYLPSAFFLLTIAALVARRKTSADSHPEREALPPRRTRGRIKGDTTLYIKGRVPFHSVICFIAILFAVRTITYAWQWNDRLRLYQYSLARQPHSIRLYMLLADEYMKRGDLLAAERTDAAGRAVQPDYWDIYVQSAVVAEKLGKLRTADAFLHRAMMIRPSMAIVARRNELHTRHPELNEPEAPSTRG
jgi:protein O-mannosyl-transferase